MMPPCVMGLLYTSENPSVYLGENECERDSIFILLRKYLGSCGICEVVLGTRRSSTSQFEDCLSRDSITFRFILFWVEKGKKNTPRWYCVFLLSPIRGRCGLIDLLLMLRLIWVIDETRELGPVLVMVSCAFEKTVYSSVSPVVSL